MSQNARQLSARSTDSGGLLDLAYSYDANGNVSAITDYTAAGRQTRSMGYDARDRLTSVSSLLYPGGASYTYDVLDNVTRATVAGRDHVYWYDANNRLTNVLNGPGGASIIGLGYDVRGNVNNKNGNLFTEMELRRRSSEYQSAGAFATYPSCFLRRGFRWKKNIRKDYFQWRALVRHFCLYVKELG
ncbi:RHS repeat domain-containing protein [Stenotrophomonas sp. MYb238]|uniref:RHS repeat domain-containing protein n=1 Tax=Stenotrophomonas sp. MYb238 TaxID=2040281 RepID=UPI0018858A43|nr:RHS repeat domain-containing protein [Stenotrophomonas sp. MYb238]